MEASAMIDKLNAIIAANAYPLDWSAELFSIFPDWQSWLDTISKFLPVTIFAAGTAAAVIAYKKYKSDLEAQQSANALHTYRKYLELALDRTQYAEPKYADVNKWLKEDAKELSQYEWFL